MSSGTPENANERRMSLLSFLELELKKHQAKCDLVTNVFRQTGLLAVDVPADGDCGAWSLFYLLSDPGVEVESLTKEQAREVRQKLGEQWAVACLMRPWSLICNRHRHDLALRHDAPPFSLVFKTAAREFMSMSSDHTWRRGKRVGEDNPTFCLWNCLLVAPFCMAVHFFRLSKCLHVF